MPVTATSPVRFVFPSLAHNGTQCSDTEDGEWTEMTCVKNNPGIQGDDVVTRKTTRKKNRRAFLYGGLFLMVVGALFIVYDPIYVFLRWMATFRKGSYSFDVWRLHPSKYSVFVYIFNYTNSDAFLRGEEKLKFEEIGPYAYRELVDYRNLTFNDNGTFSYIPLRTVVPDPDYTRGDPMTDIITVPNLALLGMASYIADSPYFVKVGFNLFASYLESKPFLKMTVHEFLTGYDEPLLEYASKILPHATPGNRLGYLKSIYDEGINTVTINMNLLPEYRSNGQEIIGLTIDKYNGSPGLRHYGYVDDDNSTHNYCNTLQGISSEGVILPRGTHTEDKVAIYRKSLCRSYAFRFANHTRTSLGIPAFFFNFTVHEFHSTVPENSCLCNEEDGPCLPDGLSDVSACNFDMPLAFSKPHFLHGDPKLLEAWDALSPDLQRHDSYGMVEPVLGVMIRAHIRLQVNLVVKNTVHNRKVAPLKNMILPVFWVDNEMNEMPLFYHLQVFLLVMVAPIGSRLASAAIFMTGVTLIALFCLRCRHSRRRI